MTSNLNLKENIDFLLSEVDRRHVNDPISSQLINIIDNLLLVDKEETLKYIKSINNDMIMSQILVCVFSSGVAKFPSRKFVEICKKQMDRFKDSKCYPIMLMNYNNALKYLELEKKFKEERKVYMQRLKEGKEE